MDTRKEVELITEIPIEQWTEFFDNLSRDLDGWETHVEVLSSEPGPRVLVQGQPFHGLTAKSSDGQPTIELLVGRANCLQSHKVGRPVRVSFEGSGLGPEGMLDIDDAFGTRILIKFVEPNPILLEDADTDIGSAAAGNKN